jgi:Zn-dependent protease with chaperone function
MFQVDAVRVGPTQFPRLHTLFTEVCTTLDWKEQPELFVTETPFVNAGAYGMDKPFIVINSGAIKLLDEDEMRALLGHELGHVMSGHALYYTMMVLLINTSSSMMPFLAGIALLPIQLALLEWSRKSEISSDRAGLLATQNPSAALRMYLKFAGGGEAKDLDLDAFLTQAKEMEGLDSVLKILSALGRSHPFNTVRAAELQCWIEQGYYDRILNGEYQKRGSKVDQQKIDKDSARDYYIKETKTVAKGVVGTAKRGIKEGLGKLIK